MPAVQEASKPSFESVWAALQETGRRMKETDRQMQETDRRFKETERIMKENAAEQRIRSRELDLKIGHLTNLLGEVTEYTMAPKLCEKFLAFNLDFYQANRNVVINNNIHKIYLEIDIVLENGDKAMLVEVKNKLSHERIDKHTERLNKMRKYADLRGDTRAFLGAVAGVVITDDVRQYALDQGFYLIEPSGESFTITPPNGSPKEW